jgi:hypothetical protein
MKILFLPGAALAIVASSASTAPAQPTARPLAQIDSIAGLITVSVAEFATIPDLDGIAPRMMLMIDEPGTKRFFVNDMRGPIYSVSYDGKTVTKYININDSTFGVNVQAQGRERGMQSFAFHPQFAHAGTPGYGKFYTWTDSRNTAGPFDFDHPHTASTHYTVLHEWTAKDAAAPTYDGGLPREVMTFKHPYANHNGGMAVFNPTARPGSADYGLLYLGSADGGSGGDPQRVSQNLGNAFGKVLRIDPLGRNSRNGKYGIPASNPFVGKPEVLPEIYAYGVRNPQRFAWDPANGTMYLAEIGQNIVEEISTVAAGGNLGWNIWEGSFKYAGRTGVEAAPRDPAMVYPVVEYQHDDPLFQRQVAATGVHVFRTDAVPALKNKVLFGDNPSGELFWFDADKLPQGGVTGMHRVLLQPAGGQPTKLLTLIREKNVQQSRPQQATRADLRFGSAADGRLFLLNKADGTIRVVLK